ncbi:MAG TPA: hypothetical protein VFP12_03080 [Allosphingosinicella sp.]|nr:hypothetical protein [Allosphingosinicella sp.]
MPLRRHAILSALLLLLAVSLVANVLLYRQASRPLFEEADRPLIERTIARSPRIGSEDVRSVTFPIVMRRGDRTCVELRRYDRLGYTGACYDRQGRLIEETAGVTG